MALRLSKIRFRFNLLALFAAIFVAAITVRFVVQRELHRSRAFKVLENCESIQPPQITLFGGRGKGDFDPIAEPVWFTVRQRIAKMLFVSTVPWHDDCTLLIGAKGKSAIRLARTCADLKVFATDERLSIIRRVYSPIDTTERPVINFPEAER